MKRYISLLMVLMLWVAFTGCAIHNTGETEVGVRVKKFPLLGSRGVDTDLFEPGGTYFMLPIVNDFYTFDISLQNLKMVANDETRGLVEKVVGKSKIRKGSDQRLWFKTERGNDISLEVTLVWRLDRAKLPYILENIGTSVEDVEQKILWPLSRGRIRDFFGELHTEQFYHAAPRTKKAEEARLALQEILAPYGIIIEKVLAGTYEFNKEYHNAVKNKKNADADVEKVIAQQSEKEEYWKKELKKIEAQFNQLKANADGEAAQKRTKADAYYDKQKASAEATEAEGKAMATAIKKQREALAGSGGEYMVKLKILEAIKGKKIVLIPISLGGGGQGQINLTW